MDRPRPIGTRYRGSVLILTLLMSLPWSALIFHAESSQPDSVAHPEGWAEALSRGSADIYWPMMAKDIEHNGRGSPAARGLMDPTIRWSDTVNSSALGAVCGELTKNINFSGVQSRKVMGLVDSNLTHIWIKDGENGDMVWSVDVRQVEGRLTNTLWVAPMLTDTDSDDRIEVLASITDGNQYQLVLYEPKVDLSASGYTFDPQAYFNDIVWATSIGPVGAIRFSSPIAYDISSDGVDDIIIGTGNSLTAVFGNNGTLYWWLDIGSVGEVLSTPAVFSGSPAIRRIVVNSLTASKQTLRTTLVNFQGDHLKNVSVALSTSFPHTFTGPVPVPVIGDVTGDGTAEILVSYPSLPGDGRVVVYSYSLDIVTTIGPFTGYFETSPALGDLNGDSKMDVVLHSRFVTTSSRVRMAAYEVYLQDTTYSSRILWEKGGSSLGTTPLYSPPLLCDVDSSGLVDAFFFSGNWIYCISNSGEYLWNLSIPAPVSANGIVGDLGSDDFTDLYIDGLMISQKVIDLKVKEPWTENIYLSTDTPVEGASIDVICLVQNVGTSPAEDVVVRFLDISEGRATVLIGYDTLTQVVSTAEASMVWIPEGQGLHTIEVSIDPNGTIIELDDDNNVGSRVFDVGPSYPDLAVSGVHFLRADGKEAGEKRLVEGDPSTIVISVVNIGQKASAPAVVQVLVDGAAPTGGEEFSDVPSIPSMGRSNITTAWTPGPVPTGTAEKTFSIDVFLDPYQSVYELDENNNAGENTTVVKNDTPVGPFIIDGSVLSTQGGPEEDVRVTATIEGSSEPPLTVTSDAEGSFTFNIGFLDYTDGDLVDLHAVKGNTWGDAYIKAYSEDGRGSVTIQLTDVPTLSVSMVPVGQTEVEVMPGNTYRSRASVENTGNQDANITASISVEGNSSLTGSDVSLSSSNFMLLPGEVKELEITVPVPSGEPPYNEIIIILSAMVQGNASLRPTITFQYTVGRSQEVMFELLTDPAQEIDPNIDNKASFELYLYNKGNVPTSYNVTVGQSLSSLAIIYRGSSVLDPKASVNVNIVVTMTGNSEVVEGQIELRTSGGVSTSWDVSISQMLPDLEVDPDIGIDPADPVLGEVSLLLATVKNTGDSDISDFKCAFFDGEQLIGDMLVEGLSTGDSVTIDQVYWEPEGQGEHVITFKADPLLEKVELDEDDNEAGRTFRFDPDLSIASVRTLPSKVDAGQSAKVSVSLINQGNAPLSSGFTVKVRMDGPTGEELASRDFTLIMHPLDSPDTVVEVDIVAPESSGNRTIYVSVSPLSASDSDSDPSNNGASTFLEVRKDDGDGTDIDLLIIGLVVVVLIAVAGAGLYIWKFGLPQRPPPGEEEGQGAMEAPGTSELQISAEASTEDPLATDGPLLEMSLEPRPREEVVVVAEELEPPIEERADALTKTDTSDAGMIAEV